MRYNRNEPQCMKNSLKCTRITNGDYWQCSEKHSSEVAFIFAKFKINKMFGQLYLLIPVFRRLKEPIDLRTVTFTGAHFKYKTLVFVGIV